MQANLRYLNIFSDSVDHAESRDISFYPIPWKSDFEILVKILKLRGRRPYAWVFLPESAKLCVYLFMLVRAPERYWYQKM